MQQKADKLQLVIVWVMYFRFLPATTLGAPTITIREASHAAAGSSSSTATSQTDTGMLNGDPKNTELFTSQEYWEKVFKIAQFIKIPHQIKKKSLPFIT